jgi:hypothetical protein
MEIELQILLANLTRRSALPMSSSIAMYPVPLIENPQHYGCWAS